MAKFEYEWQGADKVRRRGEIEAPDREAAFAALRAQGIRAIRVEPKGWETGRGYKGSFMRTVVASAVAAVLAGLGVWWMMAGEARDMERETRTADAKDGFAKTDERNSTSGRIAKARPRRYLPDWPKLRGRLDEIFVHPTERVMALFAQPGEWDADMQRVQMYPEGDKNSKRSITARVLVGIELPEIDETDLYDAIDDDIWLKDGEEKAVADLKRIVVGMKHEAAMLLSMGKSAKEILVYLVERQRMEMNCRREIIADWNPSAPDAEVRRAELEAQLSAMNFAPLK